MTPHILNLDSDFDWTAEVSNIWAQIDWEAIRQRVGPQVTPENWAARRCELGTIGLLSSLSIEKAYWHPPWEEERNRDNKQDEHSEVREWRERQMGGRSNHDENRSDLPKRKPRFNGEEPFLRPPRTGGPGIVECYGVYVGKASAMMESRGLLDKLPVALHERPAIFLCPERIYEIYPTLLRLDETLRHPLSLSSNPVLAALRMTLLHELGHHFFPVHRSCAGPYLGEALANLFCYHGLNQHEQAWLLYKSWFLQPPEYSAYRPLGVLCDADADIGRAQAECFSGNLAGWAALPKKGSHALDVRLGASLTMAVAADSAASVGLWRDELRQLVSKENKGLLDWDGGHLHFHMRHRAGDIPADFVLDLYRKSALASWVVDQRLPDDFWCGWAWGNEVRWPEDCLGVWPDDADWWIETYDQTRSKWLPDDIRPILIRLKDDPRVASYISAILADPARRPKHRPLSDAIEALRWMMLEAYPKAALGKRWAEPVAEYVTVGRTFSEHKTVWATELLCRIPDFQARQLLSGVLDAAIDFLRMSRDDWSDRSRAIEFIVTCKDKSAIPALEAAAATDPYEYVRKAAEEALTTLRT